MNFNGFHGWESYAKEWVFIMKESGKISDGSFMHFSVHVFSPDIEMVLPIQTHMTYDNKDILFSPVDKWNSVTRKIFTIQQLRKDAHTCTTQQNKHTFMLIGKQNLNKWPKQKKILLSFSINNGCRRTASSDSQTASISTRNISDSNFQYVNIWLSLAFLPHECFSR